MLLENDRLHQTSGMQMRFRKVAPKPTSVHKAARIDSAFCPP
jgi:hypothetical protein